MKMKTRIAGAAVAIATLLVAPATAYAAVESPTSNESAVAADVAAIPLDQLQQDVSALIADRENEGGTVALVSYRPLVTETTVITYDNPTDAAALAAPPDDCGFSTLITTYPGRIMGDVIASCSSTVWSSHTLELELFGINPYPPYNSQSVASDSAVTSAVREMTVSVLHGCQNQNQTNYSLASRSSIRIDTVTYQNTGGDVLPSQACGW